MITSEITQLHHTGFEKSGIQIFIKRDDLLAGACQGNKFRKLKYHVKRAEELRKVRLLSFGGAFSNHLYALAYYGHVNGWKTTGIIRGEIDDRNPTIKDLKRWNMELISVSRSVYRLRHKTTFQEKWQQLYPDAYMIPEGGSQVTGMQGIRELPLEIYDQTTQDFAIWVCPFATGATAAGIASNLRAGSRLWACSVLKGLDHKSMLQSFGLPPMVMESITMLEAHLGGFARRNPHVESFIIDFYQQHGIILDPVYTGKMMLALLQKLRTEEFSNPQNILVIHTGGVQGNAGYNFRFNTSLPTRHF